MASGTSLPRLEQRPHSVWGENQGFPREMGGSLLQTTGTKGRLTLSWAGGGAPGSYSQPSAGPGGKFTTPKPISPRGQRETAGPSLHQRNPGCGCGDFSGGWALWTSSSRTANLLDSEGHSPLHADPTGVTRLGWMRHDSLSILPSGQVGQGTPPATPEIFEHCLPGLCSLLPLQIKFTGKTRRNRQQVLFLTET